MNDEDSRGAHATRQADKPPVSQTRRWWSSPFARVALSLGLLLVLAVAWVGGSAWLAKGEIQQAQGLITVAKSQVSEGDYAGLPATFDEIRQHTEKARSLSSGPLWSATEHLPLLGPNLTALRGLTEVVDDTVAASEPLIALAPEFTREGLTPTNGKVPLDPFVNAAEVVPPFAERFTALRAQLEDVPTDGAVSQLQAAKLQLTEVFDKASSPLDRAVPIVKVLPTLLGADGPRTYVVMFQNNAELRSLGGTALSFSEITVDHGAIDLARVVPAGLQQFPFHESPVIPVPDGFEAVYPNALGRFIANATLRPSGITAAQIVQAEWQAKYGEEVDGVISMDGPALSNLLAAVGPVTLSTGDEVSSANVVDLLFNEVYQRYNSGDTAADNLQQNAVYAETVEKTFGKLTSGDFEPRTLADSMSSAAATNDFTVWLRDPTEREALEPTSFAASGLAASNPTTDVVGMYVNDQVGSKLGYYADSTVTTSSSICTPDGRQVDRVVLSLTNTLDASQVGELSPSISGNSYEALQIAKGEQRYVVFAYLPKDSTLLSASVDGDSVDVTGQNDEGHPVQVFWTDIAPGATRTVSVDVLMGTPGERELQADVTPTLAGTTRVSASLDCGTVSLP